MPLHTPVQAHRGAAILEPDLSVTLDTLRADIPYIPYEVNPGHHLIIARDGITYGELIRAYISQLPDWARRRLFHSVGMPDLYENPELWERLNWWNPDWPVTPTSVHLIENAVPGLITPWCHDWLTSAA
ncbi:hypothetical protein [Nocardiopsis lucentensis]|uniref:hypothetical protein n=1 Tax=Nocardiopsis lucentensis TaxID=53441 RepID=UPI000346DF24|nr:hypothetical protein [Nocardiopsis lucentensis]